MLRRKKAKRPMCSKRWNSRDAGHQHQCKREAHAAGYHWCPCGATSR